MNGSDVARLTEIATGLRVLAAKMYDDCNRDMGMLISGWRQSILDILERNVNNKEQESNDNSGEK